MSTATSFSTLFLRNRHLLALTIVVSLAAGLFGAFRMQRLEDPRITNLFPIVVTAFPGASAERVETLVTEPLEDELSEVDTIDELSSTSLPGVSILSIELAKHVTIDSYREAFAEIRDKLESAARRFPPGVQAPVLDDKRDPAAFSLIVGVAWDRDDAAALNVLDRVAEDLADQLRALDGTEMVRLYGAPEEELTVEVDPLELAGLGLSAEDVARRIAGGDSKVPAGTLHVAGTDLQLEVAGEIDSLERVARLPLLDGPGRSVVRVGDVASVRRGWVTPERSLALADGRRSILVAARVGRRAAVDEWTAEALAAVERFGGRVGEGVRLDVLFEQARYTDARFRELLGNLSLGAFVVVAVVFLMMGWRLGLIVGLALPIVVGQTVFVLLLRGEALHQMSVYGIVIALGLLIDNAIVVADEVTREKALGHGAALAVRRAVGHLFLPLLASTLTTVLAFLPILLLPGGPGDFVGAIGASVCIAVSLSFATALTVTAALAGIFARPTPPDEPRRLLRDGLQAVRTVRAFRASLVQGLRAPVATMAVGVALPLVGFALGPSLGNSFFPPSDRDMFELRLWLPDGSSLAATHEEVLALERELRSLDEVERVDWLVGESFPRVYYNLPMDREGSPQFAHAIVTTRSNEATKRALAGLQERLDGAFPGAQILVKQFRQGPPLVADVEYRVYGSTPERRIEVGERLRRALQEDPEVVVARTTLTQGQPKLWLAADEDRALVGGLSLGDVALQLRSLVDGAVGGSMIEDLEALPVRVRTSAERRGDLGALASTNLVRAADGQWLPLDALGELELRPELSSRTRYGGLRTNVVQGYTTVEALPIDVSRRVLERLAAEGFELPAGMRIETGGTIEQEADTRGDLLAPLPMILVLMAATLVLSFRSFTLAGILGVVAVMSVGMALLSTWLLGAPVSFNTFMGTFGLIGVALNDSIVVLAAIRSDRRAAAGEVEPLVDAVLGTGRHVLATTLTTVGGFLPLIVLVGGDFWPSMSVVLAGGIVGASIMALVFVPAAYVFLLRWTAPRADADTAGPEDAPSPLPLPAV